MALTEADKKNFETLRRAITNGDSCLMECTTASGDYRAIVCAHTIDKGAGECGQDMHNMIPLAALPHDDPYELWTPSVDVKREPTRHVLMTWRLEDEWMTTILTMTVADIERLDGSTNEYVKRAYEIEFPPGEGHPPLNLDDGYECVNIVFAQDGEFNFIL